VENAFEFEGLVEHVLDGWLEGFEVGGLLRVEGDV
jgi:hypothetical protein